MPLQPPSQPPAFPLEQQDVGELDGSFPRAVGVDDNDGFASGAVSDDGQIGVGLTANNLHGVSPRYDSAHRSGRRPLVWAGVPRSGTPKHGQ